MLLELGTVAGAITGALVVTLLSATAVKVVFGIFLLGAAVLMGLRPPREAEEVADTIPDYRVRNYPLGLGICTLAGSVSGLLGIGGGPVQVPLMYLGMGVPLKIAAATSNFIMGVTAAAGALLYYGRGDVVVAVTAPLVLGVFLGAQVGSRLARRVRSRWVHGLLILVLLGLAALLFAEAAGFTAPRGIAFVLRWGSYLSAALLAVGVAWVATAADVPIQAGPAMPLRALAAQLLEWNPYAVMQLGLLLLLATPLVRLVIAGAGFARQRDWRAALIPVGVLALILLSVFLVRTR
jgi:uncharacterized membrane protein YfcA/uncharacterized membrane protein